MTERFVSKRKRANKNKLHVLQHISTFSLAAFLAAGALTVFKVSHYILTGLKYRKWLFFTDILRFIINSNGQRTLKLFDQEVFDDLYRNTIPEYYLQRYLFGKKHKVKVYEQ